MVKDVHDDVFIPHFHGGPLDLGWLDSLSDIGSISLPSPLLLTWVFLMNQNISEAFGRKWLQIKPTFRDDVGTKIFKKPEKALMCIVRTKGLAKEYNSYFICLGEGPNRYSRLKKTRVRHVSQAPSGFNSES